jgi:superfamily II DNA or RNA helicase
MNLRPYQLQAVERTTALLQSQGSALIVLPTGCGKTVCFAELIRRHEESGKRSLVVAHRSELIHQAADKIEAVAGIKPDIDMADLKADIGIWKSPVVVASVQTLVSGRGERKRLQKFDPSEFGLVIIDEAHHAVAPSYRTIVSHFVKGGAHVVGVTATPDRGDEVALGNIFKSVSYNYELPDAVRDGWLTPIRQTIIYVNNLDYSGVRTTMGDLSERDVAAILGSEERLHRMVSPLVEDAGDRRTLVFVAAGYGGDEANQYKLSERVTEIINRHRPGKAARVSQKTPKTERAAILADFRAGKIQYVVNVGVLTEGFDDPGVACVAIMRPTKSRALYAQMIGRGTRPLPGVVDGLDTPAERRAAIAASNKPDVLVIDFEGRNGKHKLIHAADILGGKELPEVIARVNVELQTNPGRDVQEVIEDVKRQKQKEEEERRRRSIIAKAKYRTLQTNPFDLLGLPPAAADIGQQVPPSDKQIGLLMQFGFPVDKVHTRRAASAVIDKLIERQNKGLPSYRQLAAGKNSDVSQRIAALIGEI